MGYKEVTTLFLSRIGRCRFLCCLALMLLGGLFSGCVGEQEYADTPQGNFEALWKLIDEHYCFLDYKSEVIGLDWDEVRARYGRRISSDMDRDALFEVLTEMLSELRDGHVNVYSAGDMGRNWSWYEDYPSNFRADIQERYLGRDYKIASGLKYRILEDNVGYVVCGSFSSPIGSGNLDKMLDYLRSSSGLILDVRDNGGGDLTTAELLASCFTNERCHVGYICHKTGPGHSDFSAPCAEYLEARRGVRWQKPVVVLTNRRCYSATNTFVRDMQCLDGVTVVGDVTGGGSGLPFSSELPCGWSVRFSACPMFDREGNQIEFGIAPDVTVSLRPEDALQGVDTLIEYARSLLGGSISD